MPLSEPCLSSAICSKRPPPKTSSLPPVKAPTDTIDLLRSTLQTGVVSGAVEMAATTYARLCQECSTRLERIAAMAREVAQARPQAIVCLCTNFPAAVMAASLEAELGLPVFDTTALGVWHSLRLAGVDTTAAAARWGSLFAMGV